MVDTDALIDSKLAHVIAVVLGAVGIAALVVANAAGEFWFWAFYGFAWVLFFDLFDDDEAFWQIFRGDSDEEEAEETAPEEPPEDPVTTLKRRYANGDIDDDEFDKRMDRLLDSPNSMAELENHRA